MEFSRAVAYACFNAGMWLMVVTGTLFLVLALAQYLRNEANAQPIYTVGTGIVCIGLALVLRILAHRVIGLRGS